MHNEHNNRNKTEIVVHLLLLYETKETFWTIEYIPL